MTSKDSGPNPSWDPLGVWSGLYRVGGQGAGAFVPPGLPAAMSPLGLVLSAVRARLVGRRVRLTIGGVSLAFTLDDIALPSDPLLLAAGQADEVTIDTSDLQYGAHRFTGARAVFRNVHTQTGRHPRIVSAPIDLVLRASEDYLSELVGARAPWLRMQITDGGQIQARIRNHPDWGWVPVCLQVEDHRILIQPQALTLGGGRSWRAPRRLRPIAIPVTLPDGVRLVGAQVLPRSVELHVRVDQGHLDYKDAMSFLSGGRGAAS